MEEQHQGKAKVWTITIVVALIVLFIIILIIMGVSRSEHLGVPWFLDQMDMQYSDPTWMNYLGYERDVAGMSPRDYYLENQINAATHVGPQYFEGDSNFVDHTGYMDMPIQYRPLRNPSAAALQKQAELQSNNLEEWAFQDLNQTGHF